MLEPATENIVELEYEFFRNMYSCDNFWCLSTTGSRIISFDDEPGVYKYAVMDTIYGVKSCIGYFSFSADPATRSVNEVTMISFFKGRLSFVRDVYNKLMELMRDYDRIEFSVICGNPVERHYDRFIKKFNGQKFVLHNCEIDDHGRLYDTAIYEILTRPSSDTDKYGEES